MNNEITDASSIYHRSTEGGPGPDLLGIAGVRQSRMTRCAKKAAGNQRDAVFLQQQGAKCLVIGDQSAMQGFAQGLADIHEQIKRPRWLAEPQVWRPLQVGE